MLHVLWPSLLIVPQYPSPLLPFSNRTPPTSTSWTLSQRETTARGGWRGSAGQWEGQAHVLTQVAACPRLFSPSFPHLEQGQVPSRWGRQARADTEQQGRGAWTPGDPWGTAAAPRTLALRLLALTHTMYQEGLPAQSFIHFLMRADMGLPLRSVLSLSPTHEGTEACMGSITCLGHS